MVQAIGKDDFEDRRDFRSVHPGDSYWEVVLLFVEPITNIANSTKH